MYAKITKDDIIQGYETIKEIIDIQLEKKDVSYQVSKDAPSTFKTMVESYDRLGTFLVYDGGDHGFLGKDYNIKFRALHDAMHYLLGLSFKFEDEKKLSMETQFEFMQVAYNDLGKTQWETWVIGQIIKAEIQGQIEYYEANKKYVSDQSSFVLNYLQVKEVA